MFSALANHGIEFSEEEDQQVKEQVQKTLQSS